MVERKQAGFTLIEITLVLAISGALLTFIFNGLSTSQARLRYTSSVDGAKESLLRVRTDALSSINEGANAGENFSTINFGRLAVFSNGSSNVQIYTLTTANTASPGAAQAVIATASPSDNFSFQYGLAVSSATNIHAIAFTRDLTDGHLQTATFNLVALGALHYGQFAGGGVGTIKLVDPDSRPASLIIDSSSAGITRRFQ